MKPLCSRNHVQSRPTLLTTLVLGLGLLTLPLVLLHVRQYRSKPVLAAAPDPQSQDNARIKVKKDDGEMVLVPAGPFVYGANQKEVKKIVVSLKSPMAEIFETELPRSTKNLPSFYVDRYEVTNGQYSRFVRETKHRESRYARSPQLNGERQPVVGVGWGDAEAYCSWAGKRLPSEEEWEKAARGSDGRTWPWGSQADDARYNGRKQANYAPVNVGSFPSGDSPYGVSDMAGNVWEMTSGTWEGKSKAMRGGSFLNRLSEVRVTVRWASSNEDRGATWLGFRCVMDVSNVKQSAAR
jgi:formylglycine-generating enzyme required for sulfatase activity